MHYMQFNRVMEHARRIKGTNDIGVSKRDFVRACHRFIEPRHRFTHEARKARHDWIRSGLAMLDKSRAMFLNNRL